MTRLITAGLILAAHFVFSQTHLAVDTSSVSFQIKNAGITVTGTFSRLDAQIDFNPKKLNESKIIASVDASSVNTGIRIRNNHLRRTDYFDVDAHPRIIMTSVGFKQQSRNHFVGDFLINMKGIEGRVSIPFTFQVERNHFVLQGVFEIDRTDYNIGDDSFILDKKVRVNIWVKATEKK